MKQQGGVVRFDVNDDKDMALLIKNGLIWKGGPKTVRLAIEYLRKHPDEVNDKVPANVIAFLGNYDKAAKAVDEGEPTAEPVEPPVESEGQPPVA